MLFCYHYANQTETLYEKVLPTVISVSIAIILFIVARYIERKNNKKELERNWYYKVIIEPNVNKIEIFVNNLYEQIQHSLDSLISAKDLPHREYLVKKAMEFDKIKSVIQNFQMDFVILFKTPYANVETLLMDLMFNIQDEILHILDDENLEKNDYTVIEKKIKEYKSRILNILHKQIE